MPIPVFNHNHVLPPNTGDPTDKSQISPYPVSVLEVCKHFGTSPARIEILKGWLAMREDFFKCGMTEGYQWLNGSFCQDIETSENRDPGDIDIVTLVSSDPSHWIRNGLPIDPTSSKIKYKVDHYFVQLSNTGESQVQAICYFYQLFSHTRHGIWKGMLSVDLGTNSLDKLALQYVNQVTF